MENSFLSLYNLLQKQTFPIKGFIGKQNGDVDVVGQENMIYVRLWNGDILEAINFNCPRSHGLAVEIYFVNNVPYAKVDQIYSRPVVDNIPPNISKQLQWPNPYTLYIRPEQFLPGLVFPKSGLTICVYGGTLFNGTNFVDAPYEEIDLTSYLPPNGACWLLVSINGEVGGIRITQGTIVASITNLVTSNIPAHPSKDTPLSAVKVNFGSTGLLYGPLGSSFKDLRWFVNGGGGGGIWGSITGTLSEQTDLINELNAKLNKILPTVDQLLTTNDTGEIVTSEIKYDSMLHNTWIGGKPSGSGWSGTGWNAVGNPGNEPRYRLLHFSDTDETAELVTLKGGGTLESPTRILNGWNLGLWAIGGWQDPAGGGDPTPGAYIKCIATGDWTLTSHPCKWEVYTTKVGESSPALVFTLSDSGTINIPSGQTYNINNVPHAHDDRYSLLGHTHDDRYSLLSHVHDDRYSLLGHTHSYVPLTQKFCYPFASYVGTSPISANAYPFSSTLPSYTTYLIKYSQAIYISDINNSSNYWRIELIDKGTKTIRATLTTASLSPNAGYVLTADITKTTLTQATNKHLYVKVTKVGSPSNIYVHAPAVEHTLE